MRYKSFALSILIFVAAATSQAQADSTAGNLGSPAAQCAALRKTDFSKIQDAPAQIDDARIQDADMDTPAFCRVQGYIAPSVGFELRLPVSNWNGKFFEVGCGGFCGNTRSTFLCPLKRGYACVLSNLGHSGSGGTWAYSNLQAQIDFGFRGAHVTALAGKAITEYYYRKAPTKSYFHGCSSGGQQALAEAQHYPWDFDGILAGAPAPSMQWTIMFTWAKRALMGPDGKPLLSRADIELVHSAAVEKCAVSDGKKRGFIEDPRSCKFDPSMLQCRGEKTAECLNEAQVQGVKRVYAGPTNSKGERLYPGGPLPGSELNWVDGEVDTYISSDGNDKWPEEYFRWSGFVPAPGPTWQYTDFDFDRDYKRMATTEALMGPANNPDLRRFKAAGGKLILYQGWADQSDIPADSIDYYETTEKTMGGHAQTVDFFRMFMVPGMHHCSGGAGAFAIDYLSYLEAWVEKGNPPDQMIGAHVVGTNWLQSFMLKFPLDPSIPVSFTRPVYPYPLGTKYKGSGSPDDAANFTSVGPPR